MIDVVYRCKVVPGRTGQAVEWAKRHFALNAGAGLLAQAVSILLPRTGDADAILWVDRYPSMAAYEDNYDRKAPADAGWVAGMKEMEEADWYRGMEIAIYDVVESSV